eukprot:2108642-Prymnesium_polylepis.1
MFAILPFPQAPKGLDKLELLPSMPFFPSLFHPIMKPSPLVTERVVLEPRRQPAAAMLSPCCGGSCPSAESFRACCSLSASGCFSAMRGGSGSAAGRGRRVAPRLSAGTVAVMDRPGAPGSLQRLQPNARLFGGSGERSYTALDGPVAGPE